MSNLRFQVLKLFKKLHRTRKIVFKDDVRALSEARKEINNNFKKNKELKKADEITKLLKLASEVEIELRTNVIQTFEKKPGLYEARIREEIPRLDNISFRENNGPKSRKKGNCSNGKI